MTILRHLISAFLITISTLIIFLFSFFSLILNLKPLVRYAALIWAKTCLKIIYKIHNISVPEPQSNDPSLCSKQIVLFAKHVSVWETMYLFVYFKGKVSFILKRQLFYIPIFGWYLYILNMIGIERANGIEAVKKIKSQINNAFNSGNTIIIFPQGTRVKYDSNYSLEKYPYKTAGVKILAQSLPAATFYTCVNNSFITFGRTLFDTKKSGKILLKFKNIAQTQDRTAFISDVISDMEQETQNVLG